MIVPYRCLLLTALCLLAGCAPTEGFLLPRALTPVVTDCPAYEVLKPTPEDIAIRLDQVHRGSRGGVLWLTVTNCALPNGSSSAVTFDWSAVRIRLGSGQYRQVIEGREFQQLCREFGAGAYGVSVEDLGKLMPAKGIVHHLQPGETLSVAIPFGAQREEKGLVLHFDQALRSEAGASRGPLALAIALPELLPVEQAPAWWPDWLHFGVAVTSDG